MTRARTLRRRLCRLPRATDGAAIIEFAFVAPVLMLLVMGSLDIGHTLYVKAVLEGVVQKAARDSTLQTGSSQASATALDNKVRARIKVLDAAITDNDITITRRYYRDYAAMSAHQFEPYNDANNSKKCDNGETYTDNNSNGVWDADGADSGQGGAQDKAVYTVKVQYSRLFPLDKILNLSNTINLSASTTLANQPYAEQAVYATPVSRTCT